MNLTGKGMSSRWMPKNILTKQRVMGQIPFLLFESAVGLFVSASLLLHTKVDFSGDPASLWPTNFMNPLNVHDGVFIIFAGLLVGFTLDTLRRVLWSRYSFSRRGQNLSGAAVGESFDGQDSFFRFLGDHVRFASIAQLSIMVCWVLVWLNYLPGTSMNDQLAVIGGPVQFANNHPLLYNLFLSGFVRVGEFLTGSGFYGFACYIIVQMLFCSLVVVLCSTWLRYRGVSRRVSVLVVLFFALTPIISNYAMSAVKDTAFAYVMLLWIPFFGEVCIQGKPFWKERRHLCCLVLLVAGTSLTRNNGLYVAVAVSCIIILISSGFRRRVSLVLVFALAISLLPNAFLAYRGITQLFRESVGIPLQQLAAVVCERESSLSDDEVAYLDKLLPIGTIKDSYAPMSVDLLKYNPEFDSGYLQETKAQFLRVWASVGLKNMDIYLRAFFSQTYGVWDLFAWNSSQSVFFRISDNIRQDSDVAAIEEWGLENRGIYPEQISQVIDSALQASTFFLSGGSCFLLILLAGLTCTAKHNSMWWALPIMPSVFLWGTLLIATPLATAFRYSFPLAVALPFVLALATTHNVRPLTIKNKTKAAAY